MVMYKGVLYVALCDV